MAVRVDSYLSSVRLVKYYLKKLGLQDKVVNLPTPFLPDRPLYLTVSKKSELIMDPEAFVKKVEVIRKEMELDGTMDKINQNYF